MEERLQKLFTGVCSRRRAEDYIAAGRVTVNGQTAELGQRADPDRDVILLDGAPLPRREEPVYILLNKPRGVVCTLSDERGRETVADLVRDCGARVYPVGRLDRDSEGLLLLTSDGDLARHLAHPSTGTEKVYEAAVSLHADRPSARSPGPACSTPSAHSAAPAPSARNGQSVASVLPARSAHSAAPVPSARNAPADALERAAAGLSRLDRLEDGTPVRPAEVSVLGRTEKGYLRLSVTIREGKNRQIRRLCAQCGLDVRRLRRVREHTLELGNLKPGRWRYLTEAEVAALRRGLDSPPGQGETAEREQADRRSDCRT